MGIFEVVCRVENHAVRSKSVRVPNVLVDTGSECTWLPAPQLEKIGVTREKKDVPFIMANGQTVPRDVGFAVLRVDEFFTIDEVVFALRGDLVVLGARTLEGMNVTVDAVRKKLAPAGPMPAA